MTGKEKDSFQKKTEQLNGSEATVHALLNATSDLAVIIDTNGIILEVSEATAKRVKKKPDRLINTCIYDYFKPEMIEFRKAYINIVIQSRQFMRFEDHYENTNLLICIYPVLNRSEVVEKLAVFVSDTTELKKNEMLLHRYSQILSTINDPIAYIDKNFLFQLVNEATLKNYKKTKEEMIGRHVEEILGKEDFEKKLKPYIEKCLKGKKVYQQDWFDFPDNQRRYMYRSYYPLFAKDKVVSGVVVNAIDVTKMKEMEEQLKLLSQTDQLTQIFNRVKFHDAMTQEINRVIRYETDLSIIMFDIDHFKRINDTYGHDVGDEILVAISNLVKAYVRETDIFARWGGEEFMILLPHTSLQNSSKLAERIRAVMEKINFKTVGIVTSSFGVTNFVRNEDSETFIKRVDRALYKAKQKGRNRVIVAQAKEETSHE